MCKLLQPTDSQVACPLQWGFIFGSLVIRRLWGNGDFSIGIIRAVEPEQLLKYHYFTHICLPQRSGLFE